MTSLTEALSRIGGSNNPNNSTEKGKEYENQKKMEALDNKIQEYIHRENTEGAKRLALDNMVVDLSDVMENYFETNGITDATQERMSEILNDFFDGILMYDECVYGGASKSRDLTVRQLSRTWSEVDWVLQRAGVFNKAQNRIIINSIGNLDVYLFRGIWAVVPSEDGEDIDDEGSEETDVGDFITNINELSEEIQEELRKPMKSNFMFYFEGDKWEIIDGVFTESHEAKGYVPEQESNRDSLQNRIRGIVGGGQGTPRGGTNPQGVTLGQGQPYDVNHTSNNGVTDNNGSVTAEPNFD